MKTLGLIGGMSWHSTAEYYQWINEAVASQLGGHSSAQIVLHSLDFARVRELQVAGEWDAAAALLTDAGLRCQAGGADVVAICTNLMHKVAPQVEAALDVPLLHIGDAVAHDAAARGVTRLGLLGTRWTMEEDFYASRLARHGIDVVVPGAADRTTVDTIIWEELTKGVVTDDSRRRYCEVIEGLRSEGAQAVVLACTEIGLLVSQADSVLPVIDSARSHASALARVAVG